MNDRAPVLATLRAVAVRDLHMQASYQFSLLLRLFGAAVTMTAFYFISKLVPAAAFDRFNGSYFDFVLVGMIVNAFTLVGLRTFGDTIGGEQATGTLELLLASRTPIGLVMTGALTVPLALTGIEMVLYLVVGIGLLGAGFSLTGLLTSIPVIALSVASFVGLGLLSAAFIVLTKRGDPVTLVVGQLSGLLGGAYFPVTLLPRPLELIAYLTPAYWAIRALRETLLAGASLADIWPEMLALAGFAIVGLALGRGLLTNALRVARRTGTLGNA